MFSFPLSYQVDFVDYVDFDREYIYITGAGTSVWTWQGECAQQVPVSAGSDIWTAAHVSGDSLISLSGAMSLQWTSIQAGITDPNLHEKTVVLRFEEEEGTQRTEPLKMTQLCVENGRAAFIIVSVPSDVHCDALLILFLYIAQHSQRSPEFMATSP